MAKPVAMHLFLKYLASLGIVEVRNNSGHFYYNTPDRTLRRNIVLRINKDKVVPLAHIHTNLQTLGKTKKEFTDWLEKNS